MHSNNAVTPEALQQIQTALAHLARLLPKQAPLAAFEYHNPLQDYQHLPFALTAAKALAGIISYWPDSQFRSLYQAGRITDADLDYALHQEGWASVDEKVLNTEPVITKANVYRVALLFDISPLSAQQLSWKIAQEQVLQHFQADLPEAMRQQLTERAGTQQETRIVRALWQCILNKLELAPAYLHPENRLDLSLDQAEALLAQHRAAQRKVSLKKATMRERMQEAVTKTFAMELKRLGVDMSWRDLILELCGLDILDTVIPQLIRLCAAGLDEGVAPWPLPERSNLGLYGAWRALAGLDINPFLQELPDWRTIISALPEDPQAAIIVQLTQLEIPPTQWDGYLRCLALELPGWSGLINWRAQQTDYGVNHVTQPTLADYLAVRLTLDRLWLNQICRNTWQIEATVSALQNYFRKNPAEYMVRHHLFRGDLPEYLIQQAEALLVSAGSEKYNRTDWQALADVIWTWQGSSMSNHKPLHQAHNSAWQLFRLLQHLGLTAMQLQTVSKAELTQVLELLNNFTSARRGQTWLIAYEHYYQVRLLQAIHSNYARKKPKAPAEVQCIFSLDNREEGLRRYLEELNPSIETFGISGFTPHNATTSEQLNAVTGWRSQLARLWQHSTRYNSILAPLLITLAAPVALVKLLGKLFFPRLHAKLHAGFCQVNPPIVSKVPEVIAKPLLEYLIHLFSSIGLTQQFSPLVVFVGHVSRHEQSRYLAAYSLQTLHFQQDGLSAAHLADLANRADVRAQLAQHAIHIPQHTQFIALQHDTCTEQLTWHQQDTLSEKQQALLKQLQTVITLVAGRLAQERCRRFATLFGQPSMRQALRQVQTRAVDIAQLRPELGMATATTLIIGRRGLTRGLFLDHRAFLLSYDATLDKTGERLQRLLHDVVPAIVALNLEYYCATVDNQRFGSGNQLLHNSIGLFGIMEGLCCDLRFGLTAQMTETHEAMRLQLVIETKISVLETILQPQTACYPLIHNGWLQLSVQEPDSGKLFIFDRRQGFIPWQADKVDVAQFASSTQCYTQCHTAIMPALIEVPTYG